MSDGRRRYRRRPARSEEQVPADRSVWTRTVALVAAALVALPSAALALDAEDPRRSQLWWFDTLAVEEAWDTSQGEGVVIAVIDTGAQLDHPDLEGQYATAADGSIGRDFVDDGTSPDDPNGHGTLVAGLAAAAANNGVGVAGVAPLARLLPVRVLDPDGRGRASTVDAGIRWAVDNGADVINLSLEVEESDGGPDPTLTAPNAAIEYAWENGVVVVAATGNSGAGAAGYPEGSPVVLVGATDREDELATFSDADRLDAVMAPGIDMISTWCRPVDGGCDPDAEYGIGDGTSFAAPVASGVLALLLGAGLDHQQAVTVLRDTAVDLGDPGPDGRFGVGRIDAAAALAAASTVLAAEQPSSAPSPADDSTAPTATPSPSDPATASPSPAATDTPPDDDEVVLDVPDDAEPAPPADEPLADGPVGEPGAPSGALVGLSVFLVLVAAGGTAREAAARRAGD